MTTFIIEPYTIQTRTNGEYFVVLNNHQITIDLQGAIDKEIDKQLYNINEFLKIFHLIFNDQDQFLKHPWANGLLSFLPQSSPNITKSELLEWWINSLLYAYEQVTFQHISKPDVAPLIREQYA